MPSGQQGWVMYGRESAWGTRATPTQAVPLSASGETLDKKIDRIEDGSMIPGTSMTGSDQWAPGLVTVGGDINHQLHSNGLDILFLAAMGAVTSTGSNPYTNVHKPTVGSLDGKGTTAQILRPTVTPGTFETFDLIGGKIPSWALSGKAKENAMFAATWVGKDLVQGEDAETPSYTPAGVRAFNFSQGTITVDGDELKCSEFDLKGDNGLANRVWIQSGDGAGLIDEPLEEGVRVVTGTLKTEFRDLTQFNHFVEGDEISIQLVFSDGTYSFTIDGNIRYDGGTPMITGRQLVPQDLPIKFIRSGATNDTAFKITTVDGIHASVL